MENNKKFILWFDELTIKDVPLVGGKNAALGEMYQNLVPIGINVPGGFAITATAYRHFLEKTGLKANLKKALSGLNTKDIRGLQSRGKAARSMILAAKLPDDLKAEIKKAYEKLEKKYGKRSDVAVRSSATAEDLPGASFAGQQETYLNVVGFEDVLVATKKCIASLFTDRAISYRTDKGFSHFDAALSVGVQKMVRSDLAASGVMFTLDTETGFEDVVEINSSYGLGEMIVQGKVTPDEFIVFKPALAKGYRSIIGQDLGDKRRKIVYAKRGIVEVPVSPKDQASFSISEKEVLTLSKWGMKIEEHFSKKHNRHQPMDIEWAKDGKTSELFIVQARPETVHSSGDKNVYREYRLSRRGKVLVSGMAVGAKIGSGNVRVILDAKRINDFKKGEVLVTEITDPDWEPIMKIASAIVTDKGGRTSHAAIVSRELGIPCAVGTGNATKVLKNGKPVTVDCSMGQTATIYEGILPFAVREHRLDHMPETKTKIMVNIGSPDEAFKNHYLPAKGVGLGRLEFIIASHIQMHPNALIDYARLAKSKKTSERAIAKKIDEKTPGYTNKAKYYVDELAEGIAKIGAAFYPYEVIIRFSDFKTNEYRKLIGGELYEPVEENPMIGWRGASRYYDPKFVKAFGLECRAMKKVRSDMGLTNVVPMIPFCRTPEEGRRVLDAMKSHGLSKATDKKLKIYVMCEIPSNVILAEEFLKLFDGMSIGSNDLTQLTLGLDRDSGILSHIGNEKNPAVKKLIADAIKACKAKKKYIGICGQAPSDHPEYAEFLIKLGIESMSLNPDSVISTLTRIAKSEKK
ncbi:MAG: phosphoenolpyruvate synthase [Patescibacteria group bacterium]